MTKIPLAQLEPSRSQEIVAQQMLGFTNQSWLEAYRKLGPVFKLQLGGETHTVICGHEADLEAWRQADVWNYTDSDTGAFFRSEMGDDHLTQLSGEAHRRSRKLILPAFGIKALQRDFDVILRTLQDTIAKRAQESGDDVDLFKLTNFAYAKALASSQLKTDLDDDAIQRLAEFEDWFISGIRIPPKEQAVFHNTPDYLTIKREAFRIFREVLAERKRGQRRDDSLDLLMEQPAQDGVEPLNDSELIKAIYFLSVAGVGNISNILVAAVWLLDQHPEWRDKLQQELAKISLSEMRTGIGRFPILKAVISEVERYYLPAPAIHKITYRDIEFLGNQIPAGESVFHVHGLAHYESELYEDPFAFNPGRWLDGSPEKTHVFGGGKHMCLGMGVARLLAPLSLGILQGYDIKPESAPMSVTLAPHIETSPTTTSFLVIFSIKA